jgi:hypothetical protein
MLLQNPLETHAWNDLMSCRRCGKHIERAVLVCPYCEYHVRRGRHVRRGVAFGLGLAVIAVAGFGAYRAGYLDRLLVTAGLRTGVDTHTPPPVAASPIETPLPSAPPIAASPPADTPSAEGALPSTSGGSDVVAPRRSPSSLISIVTRWTIEWANVRQGRSVETPIVRVLAPGRQVDVAELRDGWWALYEGGTVRGYIANSVLGRRPPNAGP